MNKSELKRLNGRLAEIKSEIEIAKENRSKFQRLCSQLESEAKSIEKQIKDSSTKKIIVSEHAILRYLERVKGLDLDSIIKEITQSEIFKSGDKSGLNSFQIKTKNGYEIIIRNRVVVTVQRK